MCSQHVWPSPRVNRFKVGDQETHVKQETADQGGIEPLELPQEEAVGKRERAKRRILPA